MNRDILLFDLDGTLTDSGPGITRAAQYALDAFGTHVDDVQSLRFFVGPPLGESFARYVAPEQIPAIIDKFREYYLARGWCENTPYPGIHDCLRALRDAGKRLFVATSKLETTARRVLEHFDLLPYFEAVCGAPAGDPAAAKKALIVRRALETAGCTDLNRAVLTGDRCYDIRGGHEAGICAVGVLYGYGTREELEEAGADAIAATPETLQTLLLQGF